MLVVPSELRGDAAREPSPLRQRWGSGKVEGGLATPRVSGARPSAALLDCGNVAFVVGFSKGEKVAADVKTAEVPIDLRRLNMI